VARSWPKRGSSLRTPSANREDNGGRCDNGATPLPPPQGEQREVVALTPKGDVVVLGTAGDEFQASEPSKEVPNRKESA
jgi:hypothetical protein